MNLIKLVAVMAVIVVALRLKLKLWQAMSCCIIATALLYGIDPKSCLELIASAFTSWGNISLILILYLITFLQRMLEKRSQLQLAQRDLNGIFNNRRINATLAPTVVGLLPSAAAGIICGTIVDETVGDEIDVDTKAFITSYYRHIPECFLPTYSAIILMSKLSGVPVASYTLAMIPMVICIYLLGWVFYVRKLDKNTGSPKSEHKLKDCVSLLKHLWTLLATILLIVVFNIEVYIAIGIVTIAAFFVYRFKLSDLPSLAKSAFEPVLVANTALVLVFKEFISHTGVIEELPGFFSQLPVPAYIVFSLIFFVGSFICGSQAIVAFCTTMAFSAIPGAGLPLMVLLHTSAYLAMQITPVHVCLSIIVDYFKSSLGGLIRKTVPVTLILWVMALLYYNLLVVLGL